jgi:hypothetical protein
MPHPIDDDVREYNEEARKALGERGKNMDADELREEQLLVILNRPHADVEEVRDDPDDAELMDHLIQRIAEGAEPDPGLTAWMTGNPVVWSK